jgi:TRAP-type C4-dicarboxylate transport system permease small subunit
MALYLKISYALTAFAVFALMALTFTDVAARYFFDAPILGMFEIIGYTLGVVIFAAMPLVTRERRHISVALLDGLLAGRLLYVKDLLVLLGTAVMIGFTAERIWAQAQSLRAFGQVGEYLDMPVAPVVYALAALACLSFVAAVHLVVRFVRRGRLDPVDGTHGIID